ncbi:unnamed protein product [Phytophthora fragariaefolia]|uniref:Unnamed protein product n=1 Tax=Phytophthora fragariaefolia TaxID=1490495 RepID=A0A9W7CZB7_9STRA|nr:unnamed protein product [Phytophthora fragariaefolia]
MGIYTVLQLEETHDALATALLCCGDAALFATALWMFPLTFELSNIAAKSMDRGAEKERKQIRFYAWTVHGLVVVYAAVETTLAVAYQGYTQYTQRCLVGVYFVQFFSFLYMIWLIVRLKIRGRKYENVQGQFVTSPVYQRLKRIMIVYAIFSLQFQLASVVMYASSDDQDKLLDFISVSLLVYQLSGLALAVTTMCSQACVLNMCRSCLPDDIEAQVQTRFMQGGDLLSPRDTQVLMESAEPPLVNPVFVFTDIESSSALWAMGDGLVMQRATEIHDNILRASLMKYRGYEITTAGDAFQLAFHTVREAVEYCLDVQLQLLVANWPKELHGMLPATRKQRAGHRLIFGGLRVRMGIHDAVEADGALILDVHAVTGKMIYTGASEVIANEIGDLGDGGQILVTKRVADWLVMYEDLVAIDFIVDRVGEYSIPQIKAKLEVYQVLPEVLSGRKKMFSSTLKKRRATTASSLPFRRLGSSKYRDSVPPTQKFGNGGEHVGDTGGPCALPPLSSTAAAAGLCPPPSGVSNVARQHQPRYCNNRDSRGSPRLLWTSGAPGAIVRSDSELPGPVGGGPHSQSPAHPPPTSAAHQNVGPSIDALGTIAAMVWTTLAITAMGLSSVATGITSVSLRRSWDLQISSVRWLFFVFFTCYCLYGAARVAYMVTVSAKAQWGPTPNDQYLADHYTTLGIFAPLHSRVSSDPLVTVFLVAGDAVHFSVASWMFPLIYELGFIARKTMDRGAEKEKEQIRWYLWRVWPVIAAFATAETVLAAVGGGYTTATQGFQLAVTKMCRDSLSRPQSTSASRGFCTCPARAVPNFCCSGDQADVLFVGGRAIYAVFTLQYQLASVISYAMPNNRDVVSNYTSVSTVVYNISGLALAITTMCSQMCVLQICRQCLPDDIEAQVEARLMQPGELLSPRDTQILIESAEPPLVNPVFVFTDIQQSSALWGVGDGLIMQRATEIHDNILRSALMKYRGYEITTAGDAFQLAFHTVREAVEYCMDVQLQLLDAPWPKELHNLLPATKKQRAGRHLIFCGLRVRMGIHDAVDSDGTLVLDVHAVTGKMTYTGASEVIANEVGDLGDGGQILVTKRVADWLDMYADLVAIPCSVDHIGNYTVPQINTTVEVFQVIPTVLAKRKKRFTTTFTPTLKRRPGHGNPATGANSFTRNDGTPPGMSSAAAERRRNLYAQRERRRQLEQGALGRPASQQRLVRAESLRPSFAFDTRPSNARTTSM